MMKKITFSKKIRMAVLAAAALCACAAYAQNGGGGDWSQSFDQPAAQPPAPAAQPPAPVAAQPGSAAPAAPPYVAAQTAGDGAGTSEAPEFIEGESNVRLGTELSAQALAAAPYVIADKGSARIGDGKVVKPKDREIYLRFNRVEAKPSGKPFTYKVGDTVDVFNAGRRSMYIGGSRRVVTRVGCGVVVGYAGKRAVIDIFDMWGEVNGGESIMKKTAFAPYYADKLVASGTKVQARVILRIEDTTNPYLHQHIVINKGKEAGVKIGDFFRIMDRERPNRFSERILEAQAVNVTDGFATLLVLKLYKEHLSLGDDAFLSFKAVPRH